MRRIALLALLAGSGCATGPQNAGLVPDQGLVRGENPGYPCRIPGDRDFIGRTATAELGAQLLGQSRARIIRWVPFGGMVTMDFSPNRLTVRLDPQNRILAMSCG